MSPSRRLACILAVTTAAACTGQIADPREGAGLPPGAAPSLCATAGTALPQRIVRLSNRQYANGVRDLLGIARAPVLTNGGDRDDTFFSGGTDRVTEPLAFEYELVATNAAAEATADLPALLACDGSPSLAGEDDCARAFIDRFASRAFRRPLEPAERDALFAVLEVGRTQDGALRGGVELVIRAVLEAPSFIYRTEIGARLRPGERALTPFEVATELALLFLDSPVPDDDLWRAAESGRLASDDGILTEVDRLLADPRVQANVVEVLMRWVGANQLATKVKASALFTEALRASMLEETQRFFQSALFADGASARLSTLFTTRDTWVDPTLASFYGLSYPGGGATADAFVKVTLPERERAGILTQPALLATLSGVDRTSIVYRGLFVARGLLCQEYPPPPPGASDNPELTGDTERARSEYRMRTSPCNGCHTGFDPFGILFEQYDELGQYRTEASGVPVDARWDIAAPASLAGPTEGVVELAERIADAPELLSCTARRMASYSLGRPLVSSEVCNLAGIERSFAESGGDVREMFRALAISPIVRTRHESDGAP